MPEIVVESSDFAEKENWAVNPCNRLSPWFSSAHNEAGEPILRIWVHDPNCWWVRYDDGATFLLDPDHDRIVLSRPGSLTMQDIAPYLLGPVLGFYFRLKGLVCLHASAVDILGTAVAFLGFGGAGKSTTAAAFAGHGYPVLADDLLVLRSHELGYLAQPAYARINLWAESVNALYGSDDALPCISPHDPTWRKRYLELDRGGESFRSNPMPLSTLYFLDRSPTESNVPRVEELTIREGLTHLIANSFGNNILDRRMRAEEFSFLAVLANRLQLKKISTYRCLAKLSTIVDAVLTDLDAMPARQDAG